ncbi:hypothetical protein R5R35_010216 [Gryllus longicercus]|uniref:Accessory gland protein n=1 Tax=Gryllus longicercus TaxID=2509291 RepID=A0AAN9Z7R5_9ORTH
MGPCAAASWSAVVALCACAAVARPAPVLLPEEQLLLAETTTAPPTAPPTPKPADPKLTLDIPQIPNKYTKNTLISSSVLLDLGVLDTDSDEDVDLDGTTVKPPPQLTVEVLPGSVAAAEALDASKADPSTPADQGEPGHPA